jgi:diadenylate cyclase
VERYKANLDKKALAIERDEFLDQVQLIQVTEWINDAIGIMDLLEETEPYIVETGSEGRLLVMRLNSVNDEVDALLHMFVKDYCRQPCKPPDVNPMIDRLKTVKPDDHERIAQIIGWPSTGETSLHDLTVRPKGYRLLHQVSKIPPGTADKVVEQFKDRINLCLADEKALLEVEGVGEKRAKSIIEGIQHVRNRSMYR